MGDQPVFASEAIPDNAFKASRHRAQQLVRRVLGLYMPGQATLLGKGGWAA